MMLSSILKEYGIDIKTAKIVRHPLKKKEVRVCQEKGMIEAYQATQGKPVFDKCTHVISFLGNSGGEAQFIGVYEVKGCVTGDKKIKKMSKDYPYPDHFTKGGYYYILKKTDIMADLESVLFVEWPGEISWAQWATNDKKVLAITSNATIDFPGYDDLIVPFNTLQEMVEGDLRYEKWCDALKNVNGIYLICDTKYGKQYIGSTSNEDGILGRWSNYAKTHDGGDTGIKAHLKKYPDAY